jgi:hypothetical protein
LYPNKPKEEFFMYETDRELAEAVATKAAEVVVLTDADVTAAKRAYHKRYYADHIEHIREYRKAWRAANPDRVAAYRKRHWENVAAKMKREVANQNEEG